MDVMPAGSLKVQSPVFSTNRGDPVLPENREAWNRIQASDLSLEAKQALRLVAAGIPFGEAARKFGFHDGRALWRWARRFGVVKPQTEHLVDKHRRIAHVALEELEGRLLSAPESIATKDLSAYARQSTNAVLDHEKNREPIRSDFVSALEAALKLRPGEEVSATITLKRSEPAPAEKVVEAERTA